MPRHEGECLKCGEFKLLTRHHVLPKRHYGHNKHIVLLCRKCHNRIEKQIPEGRIPRRFYYSIYITFMLGGKDGKT